LNLSVAPDNLVRWLSGTSGDDAVLGTCMHRADRRLSFRHLLLAATILTTPQADAWAEEAKWGAWIDAGGRIGNKRDIGEVDVFLPLAQDGTRLLFADIRGTLDDQQQREGNFGLGYREMLGNGWNLGGYGFYDRRQSTSGHFFSQATVGLEALGPDFDARVNAYLPLGTREYEVADGTRIEMTGSSIRMSNSHERAYHGGDAEAGWRVPVFSTDADQELRIYGGGYWFDAPDSASVAGPRLRLELRLYDLTEALPGSRLTLSGEIQHDEPRGTQEFLGFKLRFPLQAEAPARRLTPQERRMTDPVVRDVDIVTQQTQVSEAVKMNGTMVDSVQQLSGSNLQSQLNSAASGALLLLSGESTVTAPVTINAGQTLRGGGGTITLIGASSGKTINYTIPGSAGVIKGAIANDAVVKMADNSSLSGITVQNTSSATNSWAISANSSTGANLRNVTILSAANGLKIDSATNFGIYNSSITAAQGRAITISASSGLNVSNNSLVQNGTSGIGILADNAAGSISNNTITTNGNGNGLDDTDFSALPAHGLSISNSGGLTISGNTVTTNGTQANGIHVTSSNGIRIADNTITTKNYMSRGIHLIGSANAVISGNTIATETVDESNWSSRTIAFGIMAETSSGLRVADNTITTQMRGGDGVDIRYCDGSTVSGNTITTNGVGANAVLILRSQANTVSGNTLRTTNPDSSLGVQMGIYSHNGVIENNTISTATNYGVWINYSNDVKAWNNTITGRGDSGVRVSDSNHADVSGNTP